MEMKPPSFIILPYQLIADKEIKSVEQVLYGIIYWLTKLKNERCTASNDVLAQLVGTTSGVIQNSLTNLERRGYILRTFKDRNKRVRDEITPLIDFNTIVPGEMPTKAPRPPKTVIAPVADTESGREINEMIALFEPMNPSFERIYSNKTQRAALERMVKKHTAEKVKKALAAARGCYGKETAPVITNPLQLESKLGSLIAYYAREKTGRKLTKI